MHTVVELTHEQEQQFHREMDALLVKVEERTKDDPVLGIVAMRLVEAARQSPPTTMALIVDIVGEASLALARIHQAAVTTEAASGFDYVELDAHRDSSRG